MKVSVIIPVYKVEMYIERCLLSVINQTYKNVEIILVDDCGNDNSIEIAIQVLKSNNWESKAKIVKHSINKGLSAARNTGICESDSEYVYFLDSDDSISLDCIEMLLSSALKYKSDFVIGDYVCMYKSKVVTTNTPPLRISTTNISTNNMILKSFQSGDWYVMAVNKLIRRNFLIENDLYFTEGIIHEDELWSFMLACKAQKMSVNKNITYFYYLRDNSITGSLHNINSQENLIKLKRSNESKIKIIKYMYDYIHNSKLTNRITAQTAFEIRKDTILYTILKSAYYSNNDIYLIYIYCRRLKHISKLNIINYRLDFKTRIKFLHYFFPKRLGFIFYRILSKLRR